jgi:hypothetical protein
MMGSRFLRRLPIERYGAKHRGFSSGLPPNFILLPGGILPPIFLDVPFTTTLLMGRYSLAGVVRNAAHDVRTENNDANRSCAIIDKERIKCVADCKSSYCLTIDDPNSTDYHSAPGK